MESKFEKCLKIPTGIEEYSRKLEPDIIFNEQSNTYVFDVKYKYFDFNKGVKREDLFQLHTYVGQYGNKFNIKACGFIYPISQTKWKKMNLDKNDGVFQNKINMVL